MTRANALTFTSNFIVGFLLSALVIGAILGLNGLAVVIVLAVVLWLLRVPGRSDVVYAIAGVLVGFLLPVLLPQLSLDTVGADGLIQSMALLLFCYKA